MSGYGMGIKVNSDFGSTMAKVKGELASQGFGIVSEINMQAILKEKIGLEIQPQTILGACNPQFASKALELEPSIGLLLPCNVVIRQEGEGTIVEFLNPQMMVEVTDNQELTEMANEVTARLEAVVGAMSMAAA